jgi:hypothetical protein
MTVRPMVLRSPAGIRLIKLESLGIAILRYSLVGILVYFGLFKFTPT